MDPYSRQQPDISNLPSNYLDTIAAQPTQPTMKPWLLWTIIGGGLLLVAIVFMMLLSGGTSSSERLQQTMWRMQSVNTLANASYKTIKSSQLRAANSNLTTVLTGAEQEGMAHLPENLQKQKQPKESKLNAYFTKLVTTLEDARLNGDFDTPYAREIAYQIGLIRSEIKYLLPNAKATLKAYLEKLDSDLESIGTEFAQFGTTTGA